MHPTIIATLLPLFSVLPTTFALALPGDHIFGFDTGSVKDFCSADQSGSIPDWAANPAWAQNMTDCMNVMNRDAPDGVECKPALADGTPLGPSFNFWKGENNGYDLKFCFEVCKDCLATGINWNQAQTTSCKHDEDEGWLHKEKTCTIGFDYGVWAATGTQTPPTAEE